MTGSIEEVLAEASSEEVVADFSAAKDFTPPPKDWYPVEIVEVKSGPTVKSKDGDPKVVLKLKVTSGEYQGRTFFRHLMLVGGGAGFTREALVQLGVDIDPKTQALRFKPAALRGWKGEAKIGPQETNDKWSDVSEFRDTPTAPVI